MPGLGSGAKGKGTTISTDIVVMNSWILGGQFASLAAAARTLARSSTLSYFQMWMISLSGPISVWKKAASSEYFLRCS